MGPRIRSQPPAPVPKISYGTALGKNSGAGSTPWRKPGAPVFAEKISTSLPAVIPAASSMSRACSSWRSRSCPAWCSAFPAPLPGRLSFDGRAAFPDQRGTWPEPERAGGSWTWLRPGNTSGCPYRCDGGGERVVRPGRREESPGGAPERDREMRTMGFRRSPGVAFFAAVSAPSTRAVVSAVTRAEGQPYRLSDHSPRRSPQRTARVRNPSPFGPHLGLVAVRTGLRWGWSL